MLKKIRIKLVSCLLPKSNIATILISLGFAEEEYIKRYNNPKEVGYKDEGLKKD